MRIKMRIRENYKKLIKYIILMTIVTLVIIGALVGTSFSLFTYNAPGRKENTIITGYPEIFYIKDVVFKSIASFYYIDSLIFSDNRTIANYYVSWNGGKLCEFNSLPATDCSECILGVKNAIIYAVDINGKISGTSIFSVENSCFVAGTKIFTPKGYINIEDIKINDYVYSLNEKTNTVEVNKVTKTFVHEDNEIYHIYINGQKIETTPMHRFYAKKQFDFAGSWVNAKNLKVGDYLYTSSKKYERIDKIDYYKSNNTVYNFEVEGNHNYFITNNNYLVHNMKEPCPVLSDDDY